MTPIALRRGAVVRDDVRRNALALRHSNAGGDALRGGHVIEKEGKVRHSLRVAIDPAAGMYFPQEIRLQRQELGLLQELALLGPNDHVAVGVNLPGIEHREESHLDAPTLDEKTIGGDEHLRGAPQGPPAPACAA